MKHISFLIAAATLSCGAFAANDIMLTSANSKAGSATSIDLVSDGTATMLQFRVDVGGVDEKLVDLSKCTASLPKTHRGECSMANGVVLGLIYNDEGVSLPSGVINIGKISVRSGSVNPKVVEFLAADRSNSPVHGAIRSTANTK